MRQCNTSFAHKIYVSFSGGKDSTVLLDLVRRVVPDTAGVFVDTGLEYPEIKSFVQTQTDIVTLRPDMNFRKVIETYGYPIASKEVAKRVYEYHNAVRKGTLETSNAYKEFNGLLKNADGLKSRYNKEKWKFLVDADFSVSHKCCDVMKKHPLRQYEKRTENHPIIGTMACESFVRQIKWQTNGCNAFDARIPVSQPLSFWTEQDVLEYLLRFNVSYAPIYGDIIRDEKGLLTTSGVQRTGCIFCGFGCHRDKSPNRFQQLYKTHPKLWEYCMKDFESGGLGFQHVLDYIGVPSVPIYNDQGGHSA